MCERELSDDIRADVDFLLLLFFQLNRTLLLFFVLIFYPFYHGPSRAVHLTAERFHPNPTKQRVDSSNQLSVSDTRIFSRFNICAVYYVCVVHVQPC